MEPCTDASKRRLVRNGLRSTSGQSRQRIKRQHVKRWRWWIKSNTRSCCSVWMHSRCPIGSWWSWSSKYCAAIIKTTWTNYSAGLMILLWRQWRRIPPCPLVVALVPFKCSCRNLQFPHRVPFTKETMLWCPCPFKNEAYGPNLWCLLNTIQGNQQQTSNRIEFILLIAFDQSAQPQITATL